MAAANAPICPYCGNPAAVVRGSDLYSSGSRFADLWIWVCMPCDARVGCHGRGRRPKGTLANAELRRLRERGHALFDPLWNTNRHRSSARMSAYARLANALEIPVTECHWGHFDAELCRRAIAALERGL